MDPQNPASSGGQLGDLRGLVDRELDEARGRIDDLGRRAAQLIRARPLAALALALGAGYVVGRLLR